jgi:uncharacterized membrane protein (UPF0127 family)
LIVKFPSVIAVAVALIACRAEPIANVPEPARAPARTAPSGLERVPLEIHSGEQVHAFTVEVARTPDQQARGLMFRETLGPDEGMIFPFQPPRPASFWMRNTLIPLDMLFVRADGTIARIAANTVPMSDESVTSGGEPVAAVLELRGGRAAELGISEGDRVSWPG